MKRILIIFGLISMSVVSLPGKSKAQNFSSFIREYSIQPALSLDNRFTQIMGKDVTIWGVKGGIDFEQKYHTGIGYYWLNTDISMPKYHHDINVNGNLNMYYFTAYFDLTIYRQGRWEVRLPMDLGYGHGFYNYKGEDAASHSTDQQLVLLEPSVAVSYRVWKWISLGATVGARESLITMPSVAKNYDGFFAGAKVKISLYDLGDYLKVNHWHIP